MTERLVFARSLYAKEAVEQAAQDFAELAKIEVIVGDHDVQLVVTEPDPELAPVLMDELANHALFLTVSAARS
ncbi:MAG TPA: HxsD-like protein [Polyangiaceae bacterium]|nr:HxsD-like protein [Polyangiaceae bacterium]HMR81047.1 HxsD-like protein [Polyangiaceae bacterium]